MSARKYPANDYMVAARKDLLGFDMQVRKCPQLHLQHLPHSLASANWTRRDF